MVMPISVKDGVPTTPNKTTLVPSKPRGYAAQKAPNNLKKRWVAKSGPYP